MSEKVALFITFWAAPGKIDMLLAELEAVLAVANEEPGTLVYSLHRVRGEREGASVYEVYADAAAQAQHGASAAVQKLKARLPELLASPPDRLELSPLGRAKGLT